MDRPGPVNNFFFHWFDFSCFAANGAEKYSEPWSTRQKAELVTYARLANQVRGFNTLARWDASEKRDSLLFKASAEYLQKTYKQTNNRKSNLSTESFTNYNLKKYDEISTNSNTYTTNDDDDDDDDDDNNNNNNTNNNSY